MMREHARAMMRKRVRVLPTVRSRDWLSRAPTALAMPTVPPMERAIMMTVNIYIT